MVGAGLLTVMFAYVGILGPLHGALTKARQEMVEQTETLAWIRQAALKVNQMRAVDGARSAQDGQSLMGLVGKSARNAKVKVKQVRPDGDNGARVWLEDAVFNDVVRWLGGLQQNHGVRVQQISMDIEEAPGSVSVRVTLEVMG